MNLPFLTHLNKKLSSVFFAIAVWLLMTSNSQGQGGEEVLLTMTYPGLGTVYVNSLYDEQSGEFFLPVMEFFGLLEIHHEPPTGGFVLKGNFLSPTNLYTINFQTNTISLGDKTFALTPDDFRIGATDFFLSPRILEKVFEISFSVNISHLVLRIQAKHRLPIDERLTRERARSRQAGHQFLREQFPLGSDRDRSLLSGALVDYSIASGVMGHEQSYGYMFTGGMEVLGGDLQGTISGHASNIGPSSFIANNLRWRYAIRDNNLISGIMAGQMATTGLLPVTMRGLAITNDPVEPRRMYETFAIDGHTEPESEVELYINEQLIDFKRANELGYYRFDVPVTYGSTRISLRIFTPSGQVIVSDRQMKVPFTFLPPGVFSYNVQAGQTEGFNPDVLPGQWVAHGNMAAGINRWLTVSAGAQHLSNTFDIDDLFYYGSVSARLAKQYLLSFDAAPGNFYRVTGSVMYANNISFFSSYTAFEGMGIFNARGANQEFSANLFIPFQIFGTHAGFRLGGEHSVLPNRSFTSIDTDFSIRLKAANLRLNYHENILGTQGVNTYSGGLASAAITYSISRLPFMSQLLRGTHIRAVASYGVRNHQMQTAELQLSKNVIRNGRLQLGGVYHFFDRTFNGQLSFILDLRRVRSTTNVNTQGANVIARQNFTGSIGWDMDNRNIMLSNRHQAGRAAASVVMFVDNNNSGQYDHGDQLLPYRAVRLDQPAQMEVGRDSILRITQLQSYFRYNLSVNRNEISDPTLVPLKDRFSFITDPNQFKRIEIPFYRGGIIEGTALIDRNGELFGQGGLRLNIKGIGNDFQQSIRNFTHGGFYLMDLPPGRYSIEVDSIQLGFLNAKQKNPVEFEIKALAVGDYLEGVDIVLVSEPIAIPPPTIEPIAAKEELIPSKKISLIEYRVQIARLTFNQANRANLARLFNLDINEIFEDPHRANYIYTIGSFDNIDDAAIHSNYLKTAKCIADAFIVAFRDGVRLDSLPTPPASIQKVRVLPRDIIQIEYRVQIARLRSNPANRSNLARIYKLSVDKIIEDPHQGQLIYTIGRFNNLSDAARFRTQLRTKHGITDAFIVAFANGIRIECLPR